MLETQRCFWTPLLAVGACCTGQNRWDQLLQQGLELSSTDVLLLEGKNVPFACLFRDCAAYTLPGPERRFPDEIEVYRSETITGKTQKNRPNKM